MEEHSCSVCGEQKPLDYLFNGICFNCRNKIKCWFCQSTIIPNDKTEQLIVIIKGGNKTHYEGSVALCENCTPKFISKISSLIHRCKGE